MGFICTKTWGETAKEFCDEKWDFENGDRKFQVIKSEVVGRSGINQTYYGAVKCTWEDGSFEVFAAIMPIQVYDEGAEICYKSMNESYGPTQAECPKSILDLLTPTNNTTSTDWRRRCYKALNLQAPNSNQFSLAF